MPEAIYRKEPGVLDHTPSSALSAGEVIALDDDRAAIAVADIAADALGSVYTEGVFDVTTASATEFAAGDEVYWDVSADLAILAASAATGDIRMGPALAASGSGETTVRVDLNAPAGTLAS